MSRLNGWIRDGGEFTVRSLAKVLFLFAMLVVAVIAVSASGPLGLVVLAMFLLYLMVRTIMPAETIDAYMQAFWSGDLFFDAWARIRGVFK